MSDAWLQRTLQFIGLVLCINAAREKLLEFYVTRGQDPEEAELRVALEARRVRLVAIPLIAVVMVLCTYLKSVVETPVLSSAFGLLAYIGFFFLCCQVSAGRDPKSPWKSIKDMMKR